MNVIFGFIVLLFGVLGSNVDAVQGKETVQIIDHPHKNEYISSVPGTDKHKYGYELKENKHFHHTTTENDGVRLGCYGYVLFGKKYSTQYVADVKGYRPVYTHDLISVYPKSGGERKASFVGDFNEDEQRSQNIRYFFPDGCKGIEFAVSPLTLPKSMMVKLESQIGVRIDKKIDPPIRVPSINYEPPLPPNDEGLLPPLASAKLRIPPNDSMNPPAPQRSSNTTPKKSKTVKATPAAKPPKTVAVTPRPTESTARPTIKTTEPTTAISPATTEPTQPFDETDEPASNPTASTASVPKSTAPLQTRPTPSRLTKIPVPFDSVLRMISPPATQEDSCRNACCSADENTPKLVLPIPMKHLVKQESSCESFAKIVIPIDGLSPENLRALSTVSVNELIKTILASLS